MQPSFHKSQWYSATTLEERIELLDLNQLGGYDAHSQSINSRFEEWSIQPPFNENIFFYQRLELNNLNEKLFSAILNTPVHTIQENHKNKSEWIRYLSNDLESHKDVIPLIDLIADDVTKAFMLPVRHIIGKGISSILSRITQITTQVIDLPFAEKDIIQILLPHLIRRFIPIVEKSLILELHLARVQKKLIGSTPEERFQNYFRDLGNKDRIFTLLDKYPVLAREAAQCVNQWDIYCIELLERLSKDWKNILTTFCLDESPGILTKIEMQAGDRHRGGRSVSILWFESGFKLVYKPRSLNVDLVFQSLIEWVNQQQNNLPFFQTLKILDKKQYGWVNFVEAKPCNTYDGINIFYERIGGYLALLYILAANDFHDENLIACGEHPILIDLESLMVPEIPDVDCQTESISLADRSMYQSVIRSGLLPVRILDPKSISRKGLERIDKQMSAHPIPYWKNAGTDEMCLDRKPMQLRGSNNCPEIDNKNVNVADYKAQIKQGFTKMYNLLWQNREKLLGHEAPLLNFLDTEIRVLLRPTQTYFRILQESYHPTLLQDALDRDRFFDKLWLAVPNRPYLKQVIKSEHRDLWKGDIPLFTTTPSSMDLFDSEGNVIPKFFEEAGIEQVRNNLKQMGETDLKQQLWFIDTTFSTLSVGNGEASRPRNYLQEPTKLADSSEFINASKRVGDSLADSAIVGDKDATWLGINYIEEESLLEPASTTLYDGLPGITLYLAYLGEMTGENKYTDLSQMAWNTLYTLISSQDALSSVGGFSGWGGIIYALTHLYTLWGRSDILAAIEQSLVHLADLIHNDTIFDIISGSAGCIGSLLALYQIRPTDQILQFAIQCGDHLLANSKSMEQGLGWYVHEHTPLSGFSHGASGIAWALFELSAASGREDFRQAAINALAYENTLFSTTDKNWLDLRPRDEGSAGIVPDCMTAWCHGAPGIGLARLKMLFHHDTPRMRQDIEAAIQTTSSEGFGANHSLCHGDFGNLELLILASQLLSDQNSQDIVSYRGTMIMESIQRHGYISGIPHGIETPGLMTGLAGIGYGLLRLADPERVPSVLTLEPPRI